VTEVSFGIGVKKKKPLQIGGSTKEWSRMVAGCSISKKTYSGWKKGPLRQHLSDVTGGIQARGGEGGEVRTGRVAKEANPTLKP